MWLNCFTSLYLLLWLNLVLWESHGLSVRGTQSCSCSVNHFSCTTPQYGNCTCIPMTWRCDSDDDCGDGSDEIGCDSALCSRDMFMCTSGKCIITSWWCDGENDCGDYSDESDCGPRNCSKKEFPCANGRCIPSDWRCDGTNQCGDKSDEDCSAQSCAPNEFRCNDGACIIKEWTCDTSIDCQDRSDEEGCGEDPNQTCPPSQFRCLNSRCISESYFCDGDNDCGDWSDENKCPGEAACRDREFQCDDGLCINEDWQCDGENDCDDMSDEKDCQMPECSDEEFQCRAGRCIKRQWRCDGEFDCADNSDEDGCAADECAAGQFRCNDGSCISQMHVCNGEYECPDGSDELENRTCKTGSPCSEDGFPCQHLCLSTSTGPRCACKHGYHLALDRRSCRDIDECQVEGTCSQFCENTAPGYKCTCAEGYKLGPDQRKCKATGPDAYLMYANRADIRMVSLASTDPPSKILSGLQNAIAVDFHYETGRIFWSDITTDVIRSSFFNGTGVSDVITYGLTSPAGLAVHWPLEKILWTDSGASRIEVAGFDGSARRVLIWKNLEKPRAIVVNPEEGTLYWTDWGSRPRIEKAMLDGSERRAIIETSLFWPNGLTIDYPAQKLYWADAKHHVIETSALDGSGRRRVIERDLPHPFAITVFEDQLFWTDWQTKSIHQANKFTGRNATTLHSKLHFPMDLIVVHPLRQPYVRDSCAEDNGGCSHLCMPNNASYTCLCTVDAPVQIDEKICSSEWSTFLIFTRRSDVRWLCLDCEDDADVVFPFRSISSAAALDFDSETDTIYWSDITNDTISKANINGSDQQVIIENTLESPDGLAVDWVTRKIYWTDSGTHRIEVSNMEGSVRTILVWEKLSKPRDIIVDPTTRLMYWTDWGDPPKIERSGMDGSSRTAIVERNLTWPNCLAMDRDRQKLYWTDAGTRRIEVVDYDGKNRQLLVSIDLPHPFGLTLYDDRIYWTDWTEKTIQSADKITGKSRKIILKGQETLLDIHVFHRDRPAVNSECKVNNGGCSHLCLLSPNSEGFTCKCPTGILLQDDKKTCATGMKNFLIVAKRTDIRKVSLDVPYTADVVLPISNLNNVIALDVDTKGGQIYWSDTGRNRIQRSDLNGNNVENIIVKGLGSVDFLAVDSIGRKLYWTDDQRKCIEVSELNGKHRKVLIWSNLDSPRAIALHYEPGFMYWTDWGNKPRIERSELDGGKRVVIISDTLGWPNGLTVDKENSQLVWADARRHVIEACDLHGNNRRILVGDVPHPYGIAVTSRHIYWTDWAERSILRVSKHTGRNAVNVCSNLPNLMDMHNIQLNHTGENKCEGHNGGCSHLCLRTSLGYSCACPTGIKLQDNEHNCEQVQRASTATPIHSYKSRSQSLRVSSISVCSISDNLQMTSTATPIHSSPAHNPYGSAVSRSAQSVTTRTSTATPIHSSPAHNPYGSAVSRSAQSVTTMTSTATPIHSSPAHNPYGSAVSRSAQSVTTRTSTATPIHSSPAHNPYGSAVSRSAQSVTTRTSTATPIHSSPAHNHYGSAVSRSAQSVKTRASTATPIHSYKSRSQYLRNSSTSVCSISGNSPSTFLVFANRASLRRISMDTHENMDVFIPVPETYNTVALDFDYDTRKLYYSDVKLDVIRQVEWNGSNVQTVISSDLVTADGLAVDWVAKNLYWTDNGRNVIEVSRVDGSSRRILVDLDLDEPRAIVVFPRKGYLFWSDWGKPPKIERAYLDGNGRRVIVATDLGWPNGLTIDYEARRLYWVDAQLDRIEASDLSGKHRTQIVHDVAHPFGLTLFGPHVFWTDWHTKSIERVDKDTGKNRIVIRDNIDYLMEIKMVAATRQTGSNPCGEGNGGCSHLCLYRPHGFVCTCPSFHDSRPCSTVPGEILPDPTKSAAIEEKSTIKDTIVPITAAANITSRCTEQDLQMGRCHIIGFPPPDPVLQTAYIALSVILLIVGLVLTIALCFWKKNKKRRHEELEATLTFSNPTYSASSGDGLPSDRKVWPWKNQHHRGNNKQTRLMGVCKESHLTNLEVSALVCRNNKLSNLDVLHPPAPPHRMDSRQSYVGSNSPCKLPTAPPSEHSTVTYHTVETDI